MPRFPRFDALAPACLALTVFAAFVATPSAARADLIPPDVSGCSGKSAGDACKLSGGGDGQCGKSTCSKLDYSQGTPPKSVTYDCLKCGAAAPAPTPSPAPTPAPAPTPSADTKSKGCTIGGQLGGQLGGEAASAWPWALSALVVLGRRRRLNSSPARPSGVT